MGPRAPSIGQIFYNKVEEKETKRKLNIYLCYGECRHTIQKILKERTSQVIQSSDKLLYRIQSNDADYIFP